MAQRLIRILCDKCKQPDPNPDPRLMQLVDISQSEIEQGKISKPKGCGHCGNIGFRGRKGIFEMMRMNSETRELAFRRAPISEVRAAAVRSGMRTLLGDGKIKILKGITTPEDVAQFAQAETANPLDIEN